MSGDRKELQIINEIFEYPTNGVDNWGEAGTDWACAVTDALSRVISPGDILSTEISALEGQTDALINGLNFDTSIIQSIEVKLFIRRTFTDATPVAADIVTLRGAYTGSSFEYTVEYSGNDACVTIDILDDGQGIYTSEVKPNTNQILIKFEAKATVDVSGLD